MSDPARNIKRNFSWEGRNLSVNVLFSQASVGSQILVSPASPNNSGSSRDFLLDCGDGTTRDLLSINYDFNLLHGVFFTHEHFDHISGLYQLLAYIATHRQKGRPFNIYTPRHCREIKNIINGFMECYGKRHGADLTAIELIPGREVKLNNIKIIPFQTYHEVTPHGRNKTDEKKFGLGFKIVCRDETVVYTGDTGYFPELENIVKDVNFLVIEGTLPREDNYPWHLKKENAERLGNLARSYFLAHQL